MKPSFFLPQNFARGVAEALFFLDNTLRPQNWRQHRGGGPQTERGELTLWENGFFYLCEFR